MDFDAVISIASRNQQERRQGARPFSTVSLSLPAPKKLERKQVDSSAVRRLLEDKKSQSGNGLAAPAPATAATASPAGEAKKEKSSSATSATARGSTAGGRPSSDCRVANGTSGSSLVVSAQQKAVHSGVVASSSGPRNADADRGGSSSKASTTAVGPSRGAPPRTASAAAAAPAAARSARELLPAAASKPAVTAGGGSSADPKTKVGQAPSKRLSYAELMRLAAAKAADPVVAITAAAAAETALTSKPQQQQHRDRTTPSQSSAATSRQQSASTAASAAANGKPKSSADAVAVAPPNSGRNGNAVVVAEQQAKQRKRRGKLPQELMDLLDIRASDQGRTATSSVSAADKEKTKDKSSAKAATDSNAAAKKTVKTVARSPAPPPPQEPPRPRGIPKAQLAVAVLHKKKDAASAASARQSTDGSATAAKKDASLPVGHRSPASAAHSVSQDVRNVQRPSSSVARSEKSASVVNSRPTEKREETNLSVWDRIVGKSKIAQKPKDARKRRMIESDEDEYDEDMDDFIDDGDDCGPGNDISAEIKRIFGYDRSKFRDDDDDDANMEARFADVMKEEARSARIGREEDLEDMRLEEEYKKAKKRKKHGR